MDPENLRISAADLFLLERWDATSTSPPEKQLTDIFGEFVSMGFQGRYPYRQQLEQRGIYNASALPEADRALLSSLRQPSERVPGGGIWLRTCYRYREGSSSTDAAFDALIQSAQLPTVPGYRLVFDDSTLYDYGPGGWQRIFTRMPQMLERRYTPETYDRKKKEALNEALEADKEEEAELEEEGYSSSEDGTPWMERYSRLHYVTAIGTLYIIDEEALSAQPPETGKLLVAWYDDCGRVVRWNRQTAAEASDTMGLIESGFVNEHPVWTQAEPGEDYDWDAPLGPPYELEEETSNHEGTA